MLKFNTVTEQGLTSIGDYVPGVGDLIDGLINLLKKIWDWIFGPDEEELMRKEFEVIERLIAQCKRNGVEEIELEIRSNTFRRYNASIMSQGDINILYKGSSSIKLHIVFSKNKEKTETVNQGAIQGSMIGLTSITKVVMPIGTIIR